MQNRGVTGVEDVTIFAIFSTLMMHVLRWM
jgi:hypothetical protein